MPSAFMRLLFDRYSCTTTSFAEASSGNARSRTPGLILRRTCHRTDLARACWKNRLSECRSMRLIILGKV